MNQLFPWQESGYQRLLQAKLQQRMPHGLLLTAKAGSGLDSFCKLWSQQMLCTKSSEQPCGDCKSCRLFISQTHPDFYWVEVLEGKKQIAIDQIRELSSQLHETAGLSGWRVAVIYQAERLTVSAFNALLKTLEEPGKQTLLILAANDRSSIPATIVSRCQHLQLDAQDQEELKAWIIKRFPQMSHEQVELALQITHFAPLAAAELIENNRLDLFDEVARLLLSILVRKQPPTVLADYKSVTPEQLLIWWEFILCSMIRAHGMSISSKVDIMEQAYKLAENTDVGLLFSFRDNILFQLKELREGVSLNIAMQVDQLAMQWQQCYRRG